jgi:ribosomal protein S18 acetylase RimI-like enzyme
MFQIKIREGSIEDSPAIAELYLKSFPESVELFFDQSNAARLNAIAACGFELVLRSGCLPLTCYNNQGLLIGYCIVSAKNGLPVHRLFFPKNIWRTIKLCFVALTKLKIKELLKLGQNCLSLTKKAGDDTPKKLPGGRIISIAVHPKARGLGLGKAILSQGLHFLEKNKIKATYLEVRPNNFPAKKMYENMGFYKYGYTRDLQGTWLRLVRVNKSSVQG